MSQERLNSLSIMSIECDVAIKMSFEEILKDFAMKEGRKTSFWKLNVLRILVAVLFLSDKFHISIYWDEFIRFPVTRTY